MRSSIAILVVLLASSLPGLGAEQPGPGPDWSPWRHLAVQDGGRRKPLDTLARETLRATSDRTSFADPETGEALSPPALYLVMLFDRKGSDQPAASQAMAAAHAGMGNFGSQESDKWDRAPMIRVGAVELREALGLGRDQACVSAIQLGQASIEDPATGKKTLFGRWVRDILRTKQDGFSPFEEKALELADRLRAFQEHRMGRRLQVLPVKDSPDEHWMSVAELLGSEFDDRTDPTGGLRKIKEQFQQVRAAYLAGSPDAFREASTAFLAAVRELGPQLGPYPKPSTIDLEVAYNRLAPFSLAWGFGLIAFLCLLLSAVTLRKPLFLAGVGAFLASAAAMLAGFGVRTAISGRAPVTNLYESVVFMALGALAFGLIFGLLYRKQYLLTAAAAVATIALVLADSFPSVLDPSIRPLLPVLRSNFWLAVHVITIMLSYAAFALALAIGNITLGYCLAGSTGQEAIDAQSRFTYKILQAGVLLLIVGTFLGAAWADYSWGRFWGWDPKEVWALITLLGYLALLHARRAGWAGNRGLAAWSVVCFFLVVMAWYLVNFLGGSLHKYGLGKVGPYYVFGAFAVQSLYVVAALLKSADARAAPSSIPRPVRT